jgi:GT2 family glycosyltransferase
MEDLAVIIPTYNGTALLDDCIASLVAQDRKPSEIIVVANGSCESVNELIRRTSIDISLLWLDYNKGFSSAVNKGIKASRAQYILVLNDDAILDKGCISALLSATKDRRYGSFAPLVFSLDGSELQSAGLMFSNAGYGNRSNRNDFCDRALSRDVFSACGVAALYRRAALEDVGLFNEDFFFFFEDLELGFRLQLRGYKCLLVPDARIFHAGGTTVKRFFPIKIEQCLANSLTTAITCMPRTWLMMDKKRMMHFYFDLVKACWEKGYHTSVVKGLVRFILRLPNSFKSRRFIQKTKNFNVDYLRNLVYEGDIKVGFLDGEKAIRIY